MIHGMDAVVTLNPNDFHGFSVKVVLPGTLATRAP